MDVADHSPIKKADAKRATGRALAGLEASFFRVHFDRPPIDEKRYLRGMAGLCPGPHRSRDIAQSLGRKVTNVSPIRGGLFKKGMIYLLAHRPRFTVPLFDGFMKRTMPAESQAILSMQ